MFAEDARLCLTVVSADNVVRSYILAEDGWAYTQPRRISNELGSFETIQFIKGDQSIALLDFGSRVMCRVAGRVEEMSHLNDVRKTLIDTLAAIPVKEVPKLEQLVSNIQRIAPETNLSNILVAGGHMLELAAVETSVADPSAGSSTLVRMVMVSSVPLPKEFQTPAPNGATN